MQGFNLLYLLLPKRFPFLCLFWLPLQVSSVSNFCPHTRGRRWPLRLTCSVVLWRRRDSANKHHWRVWGVLAVSRPHWVCHRSRHVCFPCLCCLGSRLLCQELSEAGPGLCALPRSKPLRFRYSSRPQRHRLGWACILCPSQVQAAQVTRCLASRCDLLPPPSLPLGFLGVNWCTFSGGC